MAKFWVNVYRFQYPHKTHGYYLTLSYPTKKEALQAVRHKDGRYIDTIKIELK